MEDEIFSVIAEKIKEAGSDDPREVARFYDFLWVDLRGSVKGYAALYNRSGLRVNGTCLVAGTS